MFSIARFTTYLTKAISNKIDFMTARAHRWTNLPISKDNLCTIDSPIISFMNSGVVDTLSIALVKYHKSKRHLK